MHWGNSSIYIHVVILIHVKRKIKLVPEIDLVCDRLLHTEKLFVTNRKPSQLFVYTFEPVCRCTLKYLEANFTNVIEIELTNNLTLPFLSLVNNDLWFFLTGIGCEIECGGTTESNNILYIMLRLTLRSNLILKKTSRPGCSIPWIGAMIYFKTTTSLIKKRRIFKQEL